MGVVAGSLSWIELTIKVVPHCRIKNEDDNHEQHVVLEAVDAVAKDHGVVATKITTRIKIGQRIPCHWVHSKNQCTLKNGKKDDEFDEAVVGNVLKPRHCSQV